MLRVGHLVASPRVPGGVGAVVDGLIEAGARQGIEAVTVVPSHGQARGSRWLASTAAALNVHLSDRHDLDRVVQGLDGLVVHGVFDPDIARAVRHVQRRHPRLPVVSFPHDAYDSGLFETRRAAKEVYFARVEGPRLRASRAILTTAPSHEVWLRRRGVATPVHCAPLGLSQVDLARAAEVRLRGRVARSGPVRLLFLGRWDVHEKGLDLALDALGDLERSRAVLRVVGPPLGQEHRLARMAAPAGAAVTLVGYVDDIWAELARADLLLMPSRKEGFGIVGLQALLAGVPVLLSSRAGLADYVGRGDGVVSTLPSARALHAELVDALSGLPVLKEAALRFARQAALEGGWTYDVLCDAMLAALHEPLTVR